MCLGCSHKTDWKTKLYFDIVLEEKNLFKQDIKKLLSEVTRQETMSSAHLLPAHFPTRDTHKATKQSGTCRRSLDPATFLYEVLVTEEKILQFLIHGKKKSVAVHRHCSASHMDSQHYGHDITHVQVSSMFSWLPPHHEKSIHSNHGTVMQMFVLSDKRWKKRR